MTCSITKLRTRGFAVLTTVIVVGSVLLIVVSLNMHLDVVERLRGVQMSAHTQASAYARACVFLVWEKFLETEHYALPIDGYQHVFGYGTCHARVAQPLGVDTVRHMRNVHITADGMSKNTKVTVVGAVEIPDVRYPIRAVNLPFFYHPF